MSAMEIQNGKPVRVTHRLWRTTVIGILGVTALFKLLGLVFPSELLSEHDVVFRARIAYVIGAACLAECVLCIYVASSASSTKVTWFVFVFAVGILAYRAAAYANGASYCPCLGNVISWWPWLGRHENPILTSVAIWLFLTSAIQLIPERNLT